LDLNGFLNKAFKITIMDKKRSRISDRWIPAGILTGLGLGILVYGFTYNPSAIPGFILLGLGLGIALSILFRRKEKEE